MKRNTRIALLVLLALGALGLWIVKNTHWEEVDERSPLKGEAVTNRFYAAQRLSEMLGAHTQHRHDIVTLPATRAVLVITFWNWSLIPERRQRIEQWVRDGGRLVVSGNVIQDEAFDIWTGVRSAARKQGTSGVSSAPACSPLTHRLTVDLAPSGASPASSTSTQEHFDVCQYFGTQDLLTTRKFSWRLRDRDGHTKALRIPLGRGSVTVLEILMPFDNLTMLCGDSASLFTSAIQLRRDDEVDFLEEGNGGSLLALLWRYGSPVIVLAALLIALWLWRSGVRFGPLVAAPDPVRRSLAEQIRGTGRFTLRFGGGKALYAATVRALNEAASRHVPRYERLNGAERIAALASLTGFGSGELSAALEAPEAPRPPEILKTIAFLEAVRRRIGGLEHAERR